MSSDALLMNVFCYPGIVSGAVAELLGVGPGSEPDFGIPGLVPLVSGLDDATEVDMRIGTTHVEAKLTESDFTRSRIAHVERYAGLYDVFERSALPQVDGEYVGYQLIRNVLAIAHEETRRFVVLLDARRPDLLREWWSVYGAIQDVALRRRCGIVTWQEIAVASPPGLQALLAQKYGL